MGRYKKSYRSKAVERRETLKNLTLTPASEDNSPAGRAGFIPLDIRQVELDQTSLADDSGEDLDLSEDDLVASDEMIGKVNDMFVSTADAMDKVGDYKSASFIDFLIKKFSESKNFDYSKKLNELLLKLNDSDLVDTNKLLISIVKKYSRDINRQVLEGQDLFVAKKNAYNRSVELFNKIIGS